MSIQYIDYYTKLTTNQNNVTILTKYYKTILTQLKLPNDCIGTIASYLLKNITFNTCDKFIRYTGEELNEYLAYNGLSYKSSYNAHVKSKNMFNIFITFRFIYNYFRFTNNYKFDENCYSSSNNASLFIHETYKNNIEQTHYLHYLIDFIKNRANTAYNINFACDNSVYIYYVWQYEFDSSNIHYKNILYHISNTNLLDSLFFIITVGNDIKKTFLNNNCKNIYLPYYELLQHFIKDIKLSDIVLINNECKIVFQNDESKIKTDLLFVLNCILLSSYEILSNTNIKNLFIYILSKTIQYNDNDLNEYNTSIFSYYTKKKVRELFTYSEYYNQELLSVLFQNSSFMTFFMFDIYNGLMKCPLKYINKCVKKHKNIFLKFEFIEHLIKKRNIKLFTLLFRKYGLLISKLKNNKNQNLLQIAIGERGLVQNFVKLMLNSNFFTSSKLLIKKSNVKNKRVKELFNA